MRTGFAAALLGTLVATGAGVLAQGTFAPPDAATLQRVMNAWATLDPAKAAVFYARDAGLVFYDFLSRSYGSSGRGLCANPCGKTGCFRQLAYGSTGKREATCSAPFPTADAVL